MNGAFVLCLVLCIGFGVEAVRRWRLDRAQAEPEPYHLYHGPKSGCIECEDK
jgi:hypothetical protein